MLSEFAFVIHATDLKLMSIAFDEPGIIKKNRSLVEKAFSWFPPFKCAHIEGLRSRTGKTSEGDLIFCTLTPEQFLTMEPDFLLNRIVEAGRLAIDLGAKILGLGAYTAFVGRKGLQVAKALDMPVTTGSSYTAATAVEATLKAAVDTGMSLDEIRASVVGATGTIGSICSQLISKKIRAINLVARNLPRLENLSKRIKGKNETAKIIISTDINSISESDIVVCVTNDPSAIIDINTLKSGSVVCDISIPKNISEENAAARKDILVIDGGIVKLPGDVEFNFYFGLPHSHAYACMAETMILALEERYESYSIGGNITIEKVEEITRLASKHGFRLAELKSFGVAVSEERMESFKYYSRAKAICGRI